MHHEPSFQYHLMVMSWSAMWVSLGGNPDQIVLPHGQWQVPTSPTEFVKQVREMISSTEAIAKGLADL